MSSFNDESAKSSRDGDDQVNEIENLEKMKSWRLQVNWEIEEERCKFLRDFDFIILRFRNHIPKLQEVFLPEEIERLLLDVVKLSRTKFNGVNGLMGQTFIWVLRRNGYKDELVVGADGKPSPRRTTPLHHASKHLFVCDDSESLVGVLFQIYDRFDVNYTDESGLTHLHVACKFDCHEALESFLVHGHDPNLLVEETGDTPLHLALRYEQEEVAKLLLRNGANPNLANKKGFTALHVMCWSDVPFNADLVDVFFWTINDMKQTAQVDARDNLGRTPLHLALECGLNDIAESLLKNGADPNLANAEGSTPLHLICHYDDDDEMVERFLKICDKKHRPVQVDVGNNLGRTPLQLAVANCMPNNLDALLNRGADLSSFVFPTASYFGERFEPQERVDWLNVKVKRASGALLVVERLEKRGYELERDDVRTIMKFFVEHRLFEKSSNLHKWWYDHELFNEETNDIWIIPGLSLYDLIPLRLEEAEKRLTYSNYYEFSCNTDYDLRPDGACEPCAEYLCEIMSRGFFRSWALEFFMELTRYRLPIPCCEMIIEHFTNKDICNIGFATMD